MKRIRFLFFVAVSILNNGVFAGIKNDTTSQATINTIKIATIEKIRVLIHDYSLEQENKLIIKSRHGFILKSPLDGNDSSVYQATELRLLCKNKELYMQCKDEKYHKIKYDNIEISDPHRELTYGSTTYQGSLIVKIDVPNNKLLVISKLPLEDYVYSVVRYEGIPSWPIGMQKLQAMISRTYAIHVIQQHRNNAQFKHYDIKNTNLHQVYNGTHNFVHLRQAVEETRDLVVTYKDKIALTMFDTSCGGIIPAHMRHKKDITKPYLYRSQKCLHCSKSPLFQWKDDLHVNTFLQSLRKNPSLEKKFKDFGNTITAIKVLDTDKAGRVHNVAFINKNKKITLTGTQIRNTFLHKIKSITFTIKKINDRVVIHGKGVGHQKGLCQWGSRELLQKGWNLKKILSFYYPGTSISKLSE